MLLIDLDGERDRGRQISQAQDYENVPIRRALGTAIQTFDAWMLADEQTLTAVLRVSIQRQPDPERVVDAKSKCRAMLDSSGRQMSQSGFYEQVLAVARLDLLEQRCPEGFGIFARRVRGL